jgi:hypothetical protein
MFHFRLFYQNVGNEDWTNNLCYNCTCICNEIRNWTARSLFNYYSIWAKDFIRRFPLRKTKKKNMDNDNRHIRILSIFLCLYMKFSSWTIDSIDTSSFISSTRCNLSSLFRLLSNLLSSYWEQSPHIVLNSCFFSSSLTIWDFLRKLILD